VVDAIVKESTNGSIVVKQEGHSCIAESRDSIAIWAAVNASQHPAVPREVVVATAGCAASGLTSDAASVVSEGYE
jgi:hypothetical protein